MNKTRTVVTIIGIILSVALITVVAGIGTSFRQSMEDYTIRTSGDYDLKLSGEQTDAALKKMEENPDVKHLYTSKVEGIAKLDENTTFGTPYVSVLGVSPNCFESGFGFLLQEGRYPEKSDELVLSPEYVNGTKHPAKVGDKITLEFGTRMGKDTYFDDDWNKSTTEVELSDSWYYMHDSERFIPKVKKEYTVTGILSDVGGVMQADSFSASIRIFTADSMNSPAIYEHEKSPSTYIRLTDEAEKNYKAALGGLFGLDKRQAEKIFNYEMMTEEESAEIMMKMVSTGINFSDWSLNTPLLTCKGIGLDPTQLISIILLLSFVFLIIIASSVFIIRNSFAISITEKTKLYGMLASTGATPKQIRRNVYFEGLVLGLIGIPLGLLLGVGVTALLVEIVNSVLKEDLGQMRFVFSIPIVAVLGAVVLGIITIFFSVLSSARRASRISPIEAIRSNADIKISGKHKPRSYNTPGFILKLFHAGGSIAWKNMKRSKKQYRTTVISIVVSVAVYITVFTFVEYNYSYMKGMYGTSDYNMDVNVSLFQDNYENNGADSFLSVDDAIKRYDVILSMDGVDKSALTFDLYNIEFTLPADAITDDYYRSYEETYTGGAYPTVDGKAQVYINVIAVDDNKFNELVSSKGLTAKDCKNKALLMNRFRSYLPTGGYRDFKLFRNTDNLVFNGKIESTDYDNLDEKKLEEDENYVVPTITSELDLEIIGELPENTYLKAVDYSKDSYLLITMDTLRDLNKRYKYLYFSGNGAIHAEDSDKLEADILDFSMNDKEYSKFGVYVSNYSKMMRTMNNSMLIVQIFIYGFIIVIALIGITNIFNTITTNMKLRSKEFAMLQSIGMTKSEFNRMISLESLLYTCKSLLIGLPLGIAGSLTVYAIFQSIANDGRPYDFPWLAVLISILVVLILVWIIMRFSIRKVRKQNIIETIRNDNI